MRHQALFEWKRKIIWNSHGIWKSLVSVFTHQKTSIKLYYNTRLYPLLQIDLNSENLPEFFYAIKKMLFLKFNYKCERRSVYSQPQIVRIKFWKLFLVILKLQKKTKRIFFDQILKYTIIKIRIWVTILTFNLINFVLSFYLSPFQFTYLFFYHLLNFGRLLN